MQVILSRLLDTLVAVISFFYSITALFLVIGLAKVSIDYIIASLDPNTVMSMAFSTATFAVWPGFVAITFLFLVGSTFYYFKSNQGRMKIISSIGCISMVLSVLIFSIFKYL
jgi:hypothetical protein